jgi:predicted thioesterase
MHRYLTIEQRRASTSLSILVTRSMQEGVFDTGCIIVLVFNAVVELIHPFLSTENRTIELCACAMKCVG